MALQIVCITFQFNVLMSYILLILFPTKMCCFPFLLLLLPRYQFVYYALTEEENARPYLIFIATVILAKETD